LGVADVGKGISYKRNGFQRDKVWIPALVNNVMKLQSP